MAKTIGNPISWTAQALGGAASHVETSITHLGEDHARVRADQIRLNRLTTDDLKDALRLGMADLGASRTDAIFIVLIYPVVGLALVAMGFQMNLVPLLFPVAAGFALLGPLAAVGLYEISRRREAGQPANWGDALGVIGHPSFGAVVLLGLYLLAIFALWVIVAHLIYMATLGPDSPASIPDFLTDVLTTGAGWAMIVIGVAVGFAFALAVLAISVISFPLILDRDMGVPAAVVTSVRLFRENPRVVLAWGLVVAAALAIGSIPAFAGLILVVPLLGHSTWHLYRKAVAH